MFIRKGIFGALGMLLLVAAAQLPATAQTEAQTEEVRAEVRAEVQTEVQTAAQDLTEGTQAVENIQTVEAAQLEAIAVQPEIEPAGPTDTGAAALTSPETGEPLEVAQFRPSPRRAVNSSFVGIGGDIGYADDLSFAVISKIAFANRIAVRPSVLIGDDVSVLVPVTYDFIQYAPEAAGFRIIPYGGVGAAYSSDGDSDINLLLSAGVDVPVTRQITVNAQANLGLFNDTDFGVTVGAAYNIGDFF